VVVGLLELIYLKVFVFYISWRKSRSGFVETGVRGVGLCARVCWITTELEVGMSLQFRVYAKFFCGEIGVV
jgi:hypothetical protein